jgi:hypothetical protein
VLSGPSDEVNRAVVAVGLRVGAGWVGLGRRFLRLSGRDGNLLEGGRFDADRVRSPTRGWLAEAAVACVQVRQSGVTPRDCSRICSDGDDGNVNEENYVRV